MFQTQICQLRNYQTSEGGVLELSSRHTHTLQTKTSQVVVHVSVTFGTVKYDSRPVRGDSLCTVAVTAVQQTRADTIRFVWESETIGIVNSGSMGDASPIFYPRRRGIPIWKYPSNHHCLTFVLYYVAKIDRNDGFRLNNASKTSGMAGLQ